MKLLTWLKSLWSRKQKAESVTPPDTPVLTLTPSKQTATSVYWGAQYRYKPEKKEG